MTTSSPWTVDSATALTNRTLATTGKTTGQTTLDQSAYIKLMTAQLQYQDPFEPMDNTQMVAQMAQFSQLAGQAEGNKALQTIASALSGSRLSDAASWIGKSMLVESSSVAPGITGDYAGQLTLPADSDAVSIDLVDGAGGIVKTIELGSQKAGDVPFYWDGRDADGNTVQSGVLTMNVRGASPIQTASWATVAAVQSPASGADAKLITTLGSFTAADALSLS
jgi:flagellar basal-body rod modification protein FlgD